MLFLDLPAAASCGRPCTLTARKSDFSFQPDVADLAMISPNVIFSHTNAI